MRSLFDIKPETIAAMAQAQHGTAGQGAGSAALVLPGAAGGMTNQQTRHARRLYVGNIGGMSVLDLRRFIEAIYGERVTSQSLPAGSSPILEVFVKDSKKFGFVEFATMELCSTGLLLDGVEVAPGEHLKLKRPKDYDETKVPPALRDKTEPINLEGLRFQAGSGPEGLRPQGPKVFVGGLPTGMEESGIMEIFKLFGEIRAVNLVRDATGASKGYGFVEPADGAMCEVMIQRLNGMQIGGRAITVNHAKDPNAPAVPPGAPPSQMGGGAGASAGGTYGGGASVAAHGSAMSGGAPGSGFPPEAGTPSRVLRLAQLVTATDLADGEEMAGIEEDVKEECARFGPLEAVRVPRQGQPGAGCVYIAYSNVDGAMVAFGKMHGRAFGDQTVVASFYPEGDWVQGRLV